MKKPHIIFIVADQLRYDMLGRGLTPNIDSLARDGVLFDRAYCSCPLCVPSRDPYLREHIPAATAA